MVRELEAKGTLWEALFEAQERTIDEMEALTRAVPKTFPPTLTEVLGVTLTK
ncbi:MAG: hypothetical protein WB586_18715 [Chthoniobacterales bacterium]